MIHLITGKPGGGKTRLSLKVLVNYLRKTPYPIVTNCPVKLLPWCNGKHQPQLGLQRYLLKNFGKDYDCLKRVWLLDDDQAAEFFLFRPIRKASGGWELQKASARVRVVEKDGQQERRIMDFDTDLHQLGPCVYIIDECWRYWGNRNWQKTGEGVQYYSAQHRKFGDTAFLVTQNVKQLDPIFHRVAQDFWHVTNHANLRLGIFAQPPAFTLAIWDGLPENQNSTCMHRTVFSLDRRGLAQTYDTSSGVGIEGNAIADLEEKRGGLPWWTAIAGAVLAIYAVMYGVKNLPVLSRHVLPAALQPGQRLVQHAVNKFTPAVENGIAGKRLRSTLAQPIHTESQLPAPTGESGGDPEESQESGPSTLAELASEPAPTNLVSVAGVTFINGHLVAVYLSSGFQLPARWVRSVGEEVVTLTDGSQLPMARPESGQPETNHFTGNRLEGSQMATAPTAANAVAADQPVQQQTINIDYSKPFPFPQVQVIPFSDSRAFAPPPLSGVHPQGLQQPQQQQQQSSVVFRASTPSDGSGGE